MSHARWGLLAAAISACNFGEYCEGDWAAVPAEPEPSPRQAQVVAQVLPVESTAVDILFVIDNSGSMIDEQEQLGIWSREMFDVLQTDGELPDLHVGVTSSTINIPGVPGCEYGGGGMYMGSNLLPNQRFLIDVASPDGRFKNYEGTLFEAFASMARVGSGGCGFEQPFNAAKQALATPDFLRDDALLLVVFVTDEDDCSAANPALFSDPYADACSDLGTLTSYRCFEHGVKCHDGKGSREFGARSNCKPDEISPYVEKVSTFAAYLHGLKKNPAQVIAAGIYGKPNGVFVVPDEKIFNYAQPRLASVCGDTNVDEGTGATPAVRMNALMAKFGGRASQSSICERELSWAMRDVGLVTRAAAKRSRCLYGALIDTDPAIAGVQPTCRVDAARIGFDSRDTHADVPPCDGTQSTRCFTLDKAVDECAGTHSKLAVQVRGLGLDETVTVTCDVDIDAAPVPPPSDGLTHER